MVSVPTLNGGSPRRAGRDNSKVGILDLLQQDEASGRYRDEELSDNEKQLLRSGWPIIAVFGQSGAGKSTFINLLKSGNKQEVREGTEYSTNFRLLEARINGKPVVVVDIPGIDTRPGVTEAEVLASIAHCLTETGRQNIWVTGILYLHRITDTRFGPTATRIATMFNKLCGEQTMNRVMFCTTMWDMPTLEESKRRHAQLCNSPVLKEMIWSGARTATHSSRWSNAQTKAESILSELIEGLMPGPLAIQNEIIDQAKTAAHTAAGQVLTRHIRAERVRTDDEIKEIRQRMRKEGAVNLADLEAELADCQQAVAELERQNQKLLMPQGVRVSGCCIC